MQAQVIRNGVNQGQPFIEVQVGSGCYAVPVSTELPLATVVDIVVTVAEVPKEPTEDLKGADVSIATAPVPVVEESPLTVKEQKAADKEAADAKAVHKKEK